jgi:hypothetical protein
MIDVRPACSFRMDTITQLPAAPKMESRDSTQRFLNRFLNRRKPIDPSAKEAIASAFGRPLSRWPASAF